MDHPHDENYIRLYETMDRSELTMIKLAFKNRGINFRTHFEKTLQIADVYAMGYNGAIIEVEKAQLPDAREVMDELEIKIGDDNGLSDFPLMKKFDAYSSKLQWVGQWDLTVRLLVFGFILLSLVYLMAILLVENFSDGSIFPEL